MHYYIVERFAMDRKPFDESEHLRDERGRFINMGKTDVSDANKNWSGALINEFRNDGNDCLASHIDPKTGELTKEREGLHKKVVVKHFKGVKKPEEQPVMTFLGGGSATGKTTVTKSGLLEGYPSDTEAVKIDSDNIKEDLPEYNQLKEAKLADSAAGYVHEESSALAKRIMKIGQQNGYNVVLDGTGDNSVASMKKKITQAREAGMKVNAVYCTCPTNLALERSKQRGKKEGRIIKEDVVKSIHKAVSQILPQIIKEFDRCELFDTRSKEIKRVVTWDGQRLIVHDKKLWQEFKDKANE